MKIIKKGKIPPPEEYEGTCGKCKTEIECSKNEVTDWGDQRDPYIATKCPICNNYIYLSRIKGR